MDAHILPPQAVLTPTACDMPQMASSLASQHHESRETENSTAQTISMDMEPMELSAISSSNAVPLPITARLLLSHFLSTWNSRLFEMGAVLFTAAVYPHTLRPMSVYALVRNAVAMALSPALGSWIDRGDRLMVVRSSIIGQRLAVGASCALFWILLVKHELAARTKDGLFAIAVILACVEKLCSVLNLVSVERDWVVVIARGDDVGRQRLNARMRRVDLFCKLFGPLVISLINGASTLVAVWVTLAISCLSVVIEYLAIGAVFKSVPALHRPAGSDVVRSGLSEPASFANEPGRCSSSSSRRRRRRRFFSGLQSCFSHLLPLRSLPHYIQHPAFLPSFSLSLLYLTVLSFSGQMITFLLGVGYSSIYVGVVRTVSTIFELSATWIAPRIQERIGAIRGGIWFLTWEMAWLAGGVAWFFSTGAGRTEHKILGASGLVGTVIVSRIGLWGFDLCAQSIVQEEVNGESRGAFSSVETSFQNLFEMLAYLTTVVFSRPEQFRWPVVISVGAVYLAGGVYATFVRKRRGHLIHSLPCFKA